MLIFAWSVITLTVCFVSLILIDRGMDLKDEG